MSAELEAAEHYLPLPRWRIEQHDSLPSTQENLKERLRAGIDVNGVVVRALRQPAGLGRRGKSWIGSVGGSYQSVAIRDAPGRLRRPWTSLAVAIGVAEELRSAGAGVSVKWPNDLYLASGEAAKCDPSERGGTEPNPTLERGKKVAGVLSEHLKSHLLVGVGVNVANEVPLGAGALQGWDLPAVNELVLRGVRRGLTDLVLANDAADDEGLGNGALPERYRALDLLLGTRVVVLTPSGEVAGTGRGVDEHGRLMLGGENGTKIVHNGTVLSWR